MWSVFIWSTLHTCVGCELWWWCLTSRNSCRVTFLFRVAISACVNSSLVNIVKSSISWTIEHFMCVTWPLSRLCVLSTSGQAGLALISDKIFGPSSWFFIHQAVLGEGEKYWLGMETGKVTFEQHSASRGKKINQRFPYSRYQLALMASEPLS